MELTILVRDESGTVLGRYPIDLEWVDARSSVRQYYAAAHRQVMAAHLLSEDQAAGFSYAIDRGRSQADRSGARQIAAKRSEAARDGLIAAMAMKSSERT